MPYIRNDLDRLDEERIVTVFKRVGLIFDESFKEWYNTVVCFKGVLVDR